MNACRAAELQQRLSIRVECKQQLVPTAYALLAAAEVRELVVEGVRPELEIRHILRLVSDALDGEVLDHLAHAGGGDLDPVALADLAEALVVGGELDP